MSFATRYGPWAIVAGASEGVGRAFAGQLAAAGLSLILVARRQSLLDDLARQLTAEHGVACLTASIDLSLPDAADRLVEAAGDREVGLYVGNAGADPYSTRFLDLDEAAWLGLVTRNVVTTLRACHHFGRKMRERGRGGLLLVNSYACYGGGRFMACYTASKAFDLCFAESLWSELKPHGVDVLTLVLGMTDTPAFNTLLKQKGRPQPSDWASSDDVAAFGIANLDKGPVQNWGLADDASTDFAPSAARRRARVEMVAAGGHAVFED